MRIEAVFDFSLDVLHHDDGVVHDDASGEDETEERQGIDGEAGQQQRGERADDGYRHRHQRNHTGTPGLQKHHHDQHHQNHRFEQGMHH